VTVLTLLRILVPLGVFATVAMVFWPARAHDIYMDWKTKSGVSCCHDRDCAPATMSADDEGRLFARQNGQTYFVPKDAILPIPSPDGRSHLCVISGTPICAVVGEPRS